jgi:hypothetical protein
MLRALVRDLDSLMETGKIQALPGNVDPSSTTWSNVTMISNQICCRAAFPLSVG